MKIQYQSVSNLKALDRAMSLLVVLALIIQPGAFGSSRSAYLDARTAQQCQSNVALSASAGNGATLPDQVSVKIRRSGQEGWVLYTTFKPPSQTKTCFFPGQGDWDLQFGAPRFFTSPPAVGAVHCTASYVCKGGASFTLYLTDGDISGTVTEASSGLPVPALVNAATPKCGGARLLRADATDAAGHYDLHDNSPSLPDNVGAPVFGGGEGPGRAIYQVYVAGSDCAEASDPVVVSSNQMVVVNLTVKAPYVEEPSTRSCPAAGKPISIATGNMFLDQTDITIPTFGPDLAFVRSYNSQPAFRNVAGGFGPGWSHSYEQRLTFPATGIIMLRQGDGVPTYFQDMDADLTYDASIPFTKESWIEKQADGTYVRRLRKGGSETYDSAGRLTSLVDAFGNTTTLGRDGSGRLTSINAPGSRSLTLSYNASNRIATLSGPGGLIATYTYDASNRLQKVTYADERGYKFTYDGHHQLLTVSDLSGKVLETHTYSGNKAITSEISEGREKYTLDYKPLQTTVTDALGYVTTYDWSNIWGMKFVTKITGPCPSCGTGGNQTQQWTYDDKGRVRSYTNGNGKKTTYTYDANGDLISETAPDKNITTYTIGPDGRRTSMTVKSVVDPAQDKVTLYEYDKGKLKTQTEQGLLGDGTQYSYTTSYSYDANGNLTSIDGPRSDVNDVTTFHYDLPTGDLISVTPPEVGTTSYSNFTPLGQPQMVTDPNGLVTTYKYDPQRRILSATMGADKTSYTYSPSGKSLTLTLPRRNTTTYVYDTFDQLETVRDPLGNAFQYTYDLMGQTTKEEITDMNGGVQKWTIFEYDSLNRLQKIINPDGAFTEYGYDGAGNRTSMTTPRGDTTIYKYDALNRLRATVQPGSIRTVYGYDSQNNLTSVTDPNNHVTRYFYDDLGRVYREVSLDTGTTTYTYDEAGNLISKTDARGVTVQYKYDALNRLLRVDFPSNTDITYTYDTCENGKGRLCQVVDQSGTTTYSYDLKGQLIEEDKTVNGVVDVFVTRYGYDPNGNLTSMTYPSGRQVTYAFDQADRVKSVSTTPAGGSPQPLASRITYKPFGGVSSFLYGNGLTRTLSYDEQYRIRAIKSGNVQQLTYSYDSNGNITAINNPLNPARNKTYDYDSLDRLQTATGPWGSLAWTYDGAGNRLTQTDNSGASTYTYKAGTNQLIKFSGSSPIVFKYDLSGNTILENTRGYVYNQNGRLRQVRAGTTVLGMYTYNAQGQRVKKTAGGTTTIFHYDQQGQLIAETRPNGNLVAEYIHLNGQPLARVVGSTLAYIHTDHLGTPVAMTNANTKKVWEIESRPFGDGATISGTATLNLRFPGQYFDQETGLYQNWFRDYDPKIGRFISEDPIPVGQRKVEELNAYAYVANNPVNFIDPSGAQCFILGSETTVIDPYIIGGRLPTFRLSPGQTFNEGMRPVRPTPPQSIIPKPAPPPVINPTPTQIINQMPWWWKFLHPFTPWMGDPSVVPVVPQEDCKCVA